MRRESSGVVRFDLGPLVQGQMRTAKLKSAYNSLIIGPRGFGALSLWWIQFALVLRCARSSLKYICRYVTFYFFLYFLVFQLQQQPSTAVAPSTSAASLTNSTEVEEEAIKSELHECSTAPPAQQPVSAPIYIQCLQNQSQKPHLRVGTSGEIV